MHEVLSYGYMLEIDANRNNKHLGAVSVMIKKLPVWIKYDSIHGSLW